MVARSAVMVFMLLGGAAQAQTAWTSSGSNARNNSAMNSPAGPHQLNLRTVANLKVKWFYKTTAGVSSTPTVEPGGIYFVVQDGRIVKLDPTTGALLWVYFLPNLLGTSAGASTTSPAIAGDRVVVAINNTVAALDKATGKVIWKTVVDSHPLTKVHSSPVIANGHVYTGVSAGEEYASLADPSYVPSFRGSALSLSLATGAIEWKTYTVPQGYTGGGIWGSSPAVNPAAGLVYYATGNNFTVPVSVGACIRAAKSDTTKQRACLDVSDNVDSIIAVNMATGLIVWSRHTIGADAWLPRSSCADPKVFVCPTVTKPEDADFAQGPALIWVHKLLGQDSDPGGKQDGWLVGDGQKTGVYWGLDPLTGAVLWSTRTVTATGELKWGSAVDTANNMIYTALDNSSTTLGNDLAGRNGVPIKGWIGGVWSGIDSATGRIVFQIPATGAALGNPSLGGNSPGGLSVSNGVVFAGSTSGDMVGFDRTGYLHWKFNSGGVVAGSPAIYNDWVYWGTGNYKPAVANQTTGVYAFSFE